MAEKRHDDSSKTQNMSFFIFNLSLKAVSRVSRMVFNIKYIFFLFALVGNYDIVKAVGSSSKYHLALWNWSSGAKLFKNIEMY